MTTVRQHFEAIASGRVVTCAWVRLVAARGHRFPSVNGMTIYADLPICFNSKDLAHFLEQLQVEWRHIDQNGFDGVVWFSDGSWADAKDSPHLTVKIPPIIPGNLRTVRS